MTIRDVIRIGLRTIFAMSAVNAICYLFTTVEVSSASVWAILFRGALLFAGGALIGAGLLAAGIAVWIAVVVARDCIETRQEQRQRHGGDDA